MSGAQTLGPASEAFTGILVKSRIRNKADRTHTGLPLWNAGVASRRLNSCTIVLALGLRSHMDIHIRHMRSMWASWWELSKKNLTFLVTLTLETFSLWGASSRCYNCIVMGLITAKCNTDGCSSIWSSVRQPLSQRFSSMVCFLEVFLQSSTPNQLPMSL